MLCTAPNKIKTLKFSPGSFTPSEVIEILKNNTQMEEIHVIGRFGTIDADYKHILEKHIQRAIKLRSVKVFWS